jgi:cob(I)alamin adenosyltransferase
LTSSSSSQSSSHRKKVYTKYGDKGETSLLYGGRVSKNSVHTEAYGITDEAVSAMGLGRSLSDDQKVKDILRDLQRELFTIAAELATDPGKYDLFHQHFKPVTQAMVDNLETIIDSLEEEFVMPQVFVLPGGSPASSAIDMGRTIIRTAERRVVALAEAGQLTNELILTYLNRLGDLLFVLARYQDRELPIERATGDRS